MTKLLIVSNEIKTAPSIEASLNRRGFTCIKANYKNALNIVVRHPPECAVFVMPDSFDNSIWELIRNLKRYKNLPIIGLLSSKMVASLDNHREIDDFMVNPYHDAELLLRINRLLKKIHDSESGELIKCNGLTIDLVTCEVTVDGKKADLTFKEYELLKLMARNRGRVFTREALLDKIWGYDYYGGDRTVDVHMRRLRSKIEDANHTYIETVRNIGYRFVKNA
jgi:two-component system alkaline phosphatase synthesis response regulator PhoP